MVVVGAIIVNESGEVLLQQRDDRAPSFKGCWTLFGGVVESRESPRRAILRELYEELCLASEKITSIKRVQTNTHGGTTQIIYEVHTDVPLTELTLKDGKAILFVPVSALFNRDFAFNIDQVLRRHFGR